MPKKNEYKSHRNTCTQMFIAALSTIAKRRENPNVYQQMSEKHNVLTVVYMDYYSAIKRNGVLIQHG